jgi:MFS family permease
MLEANTSDEILKIPGLLVNANGKTIDTGPSLRINGLDEIPSPYLIGIFDVFVKSMIYISNDFTFLIIILVLINFNNNTLYTSSSLYLNEMVDSEKRGTYICFFNSFFGVSGIIFTLLFNFSPSWKYIQLFSIFASLMSCILCYFCLDESIRFYYMKNKNEEVHRVLKRMAKINNKEATVVAFDKFRKNRYQSIGFSTFTFFFQLLL